MPAAKLTDRFVFSLRPALENRALREEALDSTTVPIVAGKMTLGTGRK
jgi:hypothetical protein